MFHKTLLFTLAASIATGRAAPMPQPDPPTAMGVITGNGGSVIGQEFTGLMGQLVPATSSSQQMAATGLSLYAQEYLPFNSSKPFTANCWHTSPTSCSAFSPGTMIANDPSTRVQAFASYNADYSQSPPTWIETEPIVFADGEGPDPTNPLVTSLNTFDVGGKEMLVFWVYNRNNLAYVESTTGPIVGWSAGEWKGPQSPLPGQTMALSNNDTGHVQYMNTAVWSNGSGTYAYLVVYSDGDGCLRQLRKPTGYTTWVNDGAWKSSPSVATCDIHIQGPFTVSVASPSHVVTIKPANGGQSAVSSASFGVNISKMSS